MNSNYITERCLTFKVCGDITTYAVCKIANLFVDNDIDYVGYFDKNIYPAEFIVRRSNKKWNDIIKLVNSIKPCVYKYKNETFYITNERREGVLGNMQIVVECS